MGVFQGVCLALTTITSITVFLKLISSHPTTKNHDAMILVTETSGG